MPAATKSQFAGVAYQAQEAEVYFNDGREIALLHYVFNHPNLDKIRGNPQKVLDAIDEYGRKEKYLMNIGEYKAKTVIELIEDKKPDVMVELGSYVGYSAIAFAAAQKRVGGSRYYSLELSPEFGGVIAMLAELAGLGDMIKIVIGDCASSLRRLREEGVLKHIDVLFLDHLKTAYTPDLKLCEELGLVGPGSTYVADNVVKPGNPPYLEYVRSTVDEKRQKFGEAAAADSPRGNPNLVYSTKFVEGWEPSGVPDALEITSCTGVEAK